MNARRFSRLLPIAMAIVSLPAAATHVWIGAHDRDWFHPGNWDVASVPGVGAAVSVSAGADLLLTNATAPLAAFTMSGGVLTFAGWSSALRADTVTLQGGTLTLPPAFNLGAESNRVWIVAGDFSLAAAAIIDADFKGYAIAQGPGYGVDDGDAAHGGLGHRTYGRNRIGNTYGAIDVPLTPGSGSEHGEGGGVITIQATQQAAIYGILSADGRSRTGWDHGAAGGSVGIECRTLHGDAGGWLRARGGTAPSDRGGRVGGGGRLAVRYDAAAQAALPQPNPGIRFSARAGALPPEVTRYDQAGTLSLPDPLFLSEILGSQWDDVRLAIPGWEAWATPSLTVSGRIAFPDVRGLQVAGDAVVTGGGRLELSAGTTNAAMPDAGMRFDIGGELAIDSGSYLVLQCEPETGAAPYVECGRLTVAAGAWITAYGRGFDPDHGSGVGSRSASHGGIAQGTPGPTYNEPQAPILPGSGGALSGNPDSRGGGTVRISARGGMVLNGTICANAMGSLHGWGANGAGGSILLTARKVTGNGAVLRANGATGGHGSPQAGGGRIAVWTPFLPAPFVRRMADDAYLPATAEISTLAAWDGLSATLTVSGYEDGSLFFGRLPRGTVISLR